jgi:hypothetical protein
MITPSKASPNHDVAPDRAAILVSRDTMPLQAARQVNAVVRRLLVFEASLALNPI